MRAWWMVMAAVAMWMPGSLRAGSDEPYWVPYQFKGTEHFKYDLRYNENGETSTGYYVIDLKKVGDRYEVKIEGKYKDSEGTVKTKVDKPEEIAGVLFGQMFFNPWVAPLTMTLFAQSMMHMFTLGGLNWEEGSRMQRKEDGKTMVMEVKACEVLGKKGRKLVMQEDGTVTYESCVSPGVALPLYLHTRSDDGEVYELKLVEYRE